ncbi:hypothetical protein H0H87_003278 [Tephrocybe sp. NHM501043]|nr:hypothetical protein H0H87_003278 [Tephrocybe sp. NHM501043]
MFVWYTGFGSNSGKDTPTPPRPYLLPTCSDTFRALLLSDVLARFQTRPRSALPRQQGSFPQLPWSTTTPFLPVHPFDTDTCNICKAPPGIGDKEKARMEDVLRESMEETVQP